MNGSVVWRTGEVTGNNGVSHLITDLCKVKDMEVYLPAGGAIGQIDYVYCGPKYPNDYREKSGGVQPKQSSSSCPKKVVNFEEAGLKKGNYLKDNLESLYGMKVRAYGKNGGGNTPNDAARIYQKSGYGNVVVIDKKGSGKPEVYSYGGTISFEFDGPVKVGKLSILNQHEATVIVTKAGGATEEFVCDTSADPLEIDRLNVKKIEVTFQSIGGVAQMEIFKCGK